MLKKVMALILASALAIGMLAGCGSSGQASSAEEKKEESKAEESAPSGKIKVGVIIWSVEDAVTSSVKRLLDHAAEALDVELIYNTGAFDAEAQLKAAENLIASGVNGILLMPIVDAGIPKIFEACKTAGIPLCQFYRYVVDETNRAALEAEDLYLGSSMPDDVKAGYHMAEMLRDAGCTKVGMVGQAPGNDATDARQKGFQQAFDEGVLEKVTEYIIPLGQTGTQVWTEATNNFITAYPEMDGMIMSVGASGGSEATMAAIEQQKAIGKVKLACFDTPSNSTEGFEKGILCGVANGMHLDPMIALVLMVNKINGTPLSDKAVKIDTDYIYLSNLDEEKAYYQYIDSKEGDIFAFTTEEIKQMSKKNNPDFSLDDLKEIAAKWTYDDMLKKLKG